MNRGSHAEKREKSIANTCFNEAPIHESGKCLADFRALRSSIRFNEAPIHESGKSSERRDRWLTLHSFNEAPIHESGK